MIVLGATQTELYILSSSYCYIILFLNKGMLLMQQEKYTSNAHPASLSSYQWDASVWLRLWYWLHSVASRAGFNTPCALAYATFTSMYMLSMLGRDMELTGAMQAECVYCSCLNQGVVPFVDCSFPPRLKLNFSMCQVSHLDLNRSLVVHTFM